LFLWLSIWLLVIVFWKIWYTNYTYYNIPQIYKNDLKVYSWTPESIIYLNNDLISLIPSEISPSKIFMYGIKDFSDIDDSVGNKNFISPVAVYGWFNGEYWEIQRQKPKLDKMKKWALENNYRFDYKIYDKSLLFNYSNYDGKISPYSTKFFKKLNSLTKKNTHLALFLNWKIDNNNLRTTLENTIFSSWAYWIFNRIFDYELSSRIKESYVILNLKWDKGNLNFKLELNSKLENNRLLELTCANIKDNYYRFIDNNKDSYSIRWLECSSSFSWKTAQINLIFDWIESQIRINNN
jgi:hypothetical protein